MSVQPEIVPKEEAKSRSIYDEMLTKCQSRKTEQCVGQTELKTYNGIGVNKKNLFQNK